MILILLFLIQRLIIILIKNNKLFKSAVIEVLL